MSLARAAGAAERREEFLILMRKLNCLPLLSRRRSPSVRRYNHGSHLGQVCAYPAGYRPLWPCTGRILSKQYRELLYFGTDLQ